MARLPASVRTELLATIAASEAEIVQFTTEAATATAALETATRKRGRAERQLEKQRDMLKWVDQEATPSADAG